MHVSWGTRLPILSPDQFAVHYQDCLSQNFDGLEVPHFCAHSVSFEFTDFQEGFFQQKEFSPTNQASIRGGSQNPTHGIRLQFLGSFPKRVRIFAQSAWITSFCRPLTKFCIHIMFQNFSRSLHLAHTTNLFLIPCLQVLNFPWSSWLPGSSISKSSWWPGIFKLLDDQTS